jgi:hypothetical protein
VKIAKSDLTPTGFAYFVARAFLLLYVFLASWFSLFVVPALVLTSISIHVSAWFLQWFVFSTVLSVVIGIVAVLRQVSIFVGRDFQTFYRIQTVGRILELIFTLPFILASAVVILATVVYLKVEMLSVFTVWAVLFEGMAIGIILDIYGRVFTPRALAKLYFGHANESKDDSKKVAAISEAFKQLRDDAALHKLELSTTRFEQLLVTRLYEGKDIEGQLAEFIRHLSDGDSVVFALKQLDGDAQDFLALAKTERKWRNYVEWFAKYLLPFFASLLVVLVQRWL